MCPVNPLCRGNTTGTQAVKVISWSFPRCPMVVNLNFTTLVLLTFVLIISEHFPPLTLSSPIIENFDGWTKTCSSNWAHMEGGIWKLLSIFVLVSGYQMLNCDQEIAAEFGGQHLPLFTYIFCCQRWHNYRRRLIITKIISTFSSAWYASGS